MEPEEAQQQRKARTRSRRVIWFNPTYSVDVKTNVGKEFLLLVDKHFLDGILYTGF
jgi:hypothetical protein